ncbi:MAG: hypothetical protein CM15mP1_3690 [Methanobacteriota archaeon]|nr:MAG: hypothetical protein CM15mP1_3690 [Euryarchaeota archaeon]
MCQYYEIRRWRGIPPDRYVEGDAQNFGLGKGLGVNAECGVTYEAHELKSKNKDESRGFD